MPKYVSNFKILDEVVYVKDEEARQALQNLKVPLSELVVLGDSYTKGFLSGGTYAAEPIPEILAEYLGLNLHNYGVNAAGYTIPGNTFYSQANNAIADTSYDHNLVKYVIVIGGINDVNNNPSGDHAGASKLLVATLASAFTNAEIILAPCWGAVSLPDFQEAIFRNICYITDQDTYRTRVLYDNIKCLIGYKELMGNDNVHPTQEGYRILATNIYGMLSGSPVVRGKDISITALNGWNITYMKVYRNENGFRAFGFVTPSANVTSSNSDICNVEANGTFAGSIYATCSTSGGSACCVEWDPGVALTSAPVNGKLSVYHDLGVTITAGTNILIDIQVPLLNY